MQDKDVFNGVIGRYTGSRDENGVTKSDNTEIVPKPSPSRPPGWGQRHLQAFLLFTGLAFSYALRVNISVGIVAMVDRHPNAPQPTYNWPEQEQGLILSSFFWGYFVAQVPVSHVAQHFGAKLLLTIGSSVCAILTLMTPWAASIDWRVMLIVRGLQGLFQGFYYPCVHTILAKWVHPSERGVFTSYTYSGTQFGSVIMLGTSGFLAESSMAWPSIFYFSGGGAFLWTIIWVIFGANSPAECSRISIDEKKYIQSMPGFSHSKLKTPWMSIIKSTPVIVLLLVHCGQCWGFWTLLTETPTYLKQVFQFNIKTNAMLSALPYLAMWLVSMAVSPISDYIVNKDIFSVRTNRKLFNSIGHWIPAVGLIILPFLDNSTHAIIVLTISIGLNGCTYCGYMSNILDLSPNFAGNLMGLTNSFANIMSILGPIVAGAILSSDQGVDVKTEEWKLIFFIAAIFYLIPNLIFVIFGKAEIQPWNEVEGEENIEAIDPKYVRNMKMSIISLLTN